MGPNSKNNNSKPGIFALRLNNTHTGVVLHREGSSSDKKFCKMNIVRFNRYDRMVINKVENTKTKNLRSRSYH